MMTSIQAEKDQFSSITRKAPVETEKEPVAMETESRAGKHRLSDEDVSSILAMPREQPCRIPFSRGNNVAKLLDVTEEWKRQTYREAAARSERISKELELFQDSIRHELLEKGYVELDDEYLVQGASQQEEYSEELSKERVSSGDLGLLHEVNCREDVQYAC